MFVSIAIGMPGGRRRINFLIRSIIANLSAHILSRGRLAAQGLAELFALSYQIRVKSGRKKLLGGAAAPPNLPALSGG
jgi:hypothetical protein